MRTEDGHIIHKCLNGEPEAFGFLVDKYKESIYGFAYAKLLNFHDAEDVTQEVFIKAYENLRTLKQFDSFLAWLYSITSNLCKMWIRARSRRPDGEFMEDKDSKILRTLSMNSYREGLARESLHDELQEALDSLPEMYRQVLTLYYLSGMNHKEIARFLGASPMTILQQLRRARLQLKEEMLAMMTTTFEAQKLRGGFTFRILEAVKRIKIQPVPRTTALPWGLSVATGIILTILSLNPQLSLPNFTDAHIDSVLPGETAVGVGEIPVDVLKISHIPAVSRSQRNGDGGEPEPPDLQGAFPLAPRAEEGRFPEEPSARLGKGVIWQIEYSPDGSLLAAAGVFGVWLYDANDLSEVGLLEGHTGRVSCLAFSPDGKTLASGSADMTVRLWDVQKQKQIVVLRGHTSSMYSVTFSPDGKTLASSNYDQTIRLWDVQEQKQLDILRGHTDGVSYVRFSPDGKILASASLDKTVRLWDVQAKKQIASLQGHTDEVWGIAFSPDGRTLASGSRDGTIRLWNIQTHEQIDVLEGHEGSVFPVIFSPDGKMLASGSSDNTVRLWDVETHEQITRMQGHTVWDWVSSLSFSPDGETLASLNGDKTIRIWDIQTQQQVKTLQEHTCRALSVAFSPDGKILVSGCADKKVYLWDVAGQKQLDILEGRTSDYCMQPVAFSPDGKCLASCSDDRAVLLWDVQTLKEVESLKHKFNVSAVAFSPDGKILASGSEDRTIYLWDVDKQEQIDSLHGHLHEVLTLAFSLDGKLLASGDSEGTIYLWDVEEQEQLGLLRVGGLPAHSVAFSPDGKILAAGCADKKIYLWDAAEQKLLVTLEGHTSEVWSVAFSPDGKWLASGEWYGAVLLWEVNVPVLGRSVEPLEKQLGTWGEVKRTALLQNFPNPFNPETWIPFSLSKSGHVAIRIYNSTGQLVRTLDLGERLSGTYLSKENAAYWDGRNEAGEAVASDVYFYVMEAGESIDSRKMVMVR